MGTTNEPATVTVAGQPAPSDAANTFRGSAPTAAGTTTVSVTATDPNGNATTRQYEVDVAGATTTYTFDDNGNLTGDGLKTYVWNARNQLLKVQQGGADLAVFTYDGAGRRVTKTAGGVTRTYIYDGPDILEERVSTGDVIRYVHGPGMDNVLARTTNGANAVYYATDHLGSIVHETNAAGAVTLHREYDAWGELKQGQGASGFAFTGREWDAETGLYFYRARYYEPTSGRFVGEDPAGYGDGPNLAAYVGNSPTGSRDPLGLQTWPTDHPGQVTSPYGGKRGKSVHTGADLRNPKGDPVYSTDAGKVIAVWKDAKGGSQIKVLNTDGSVSGYAHTGAVVAVGDVVFEGQRIGYSDDSGTGTGPHLHLTFRPTIDSEKIDPLPRLLQKKPGC